jgi:hypothetical protein
MSSLEPSAWLTPHVAVRVTQTTGHPETSLFPKPLMSTRCAAGRNCGKELVIARKDRRLHRWSRVAERYQQLHSPTIPNLRFRMKVNC